MDQGSLVIARLVSYALLLATTGLPLHAVLRRRLPTWQERAILAGMSVGAFAVSVWWAFANVAAMAGQPIGDLDHATFVAVLAATPLGALLAVRAVSLAAVAGLLAFRPAPLALALAALPALASAAWAGHAGAGEGPPGLVLRAGDVLHLGASALWLGALLHFMVATFRPHRQAELIRELSDFARIGSIVVATLFVTGLLNVWFISTGTMPSGGWPILIAVKIALFVAMLGFAACNRWRLVPDLERDRPGAVSRLRRSLALETACAVAIVAVVAIAGLLDPHGS